mmetsp:Transcript_25946/g.78117  ORF Transcript_25946/g.78117 Transcript_25946/m.78117 type:complete len:315 (-) Transcript_25946:37-981(-)
MYDAGGHRRHPRRAAAEAAAGLPAGVARVIHHARGRQRGGRHRHRQVRALGVAGAELRRALRVRPRRAAALGAQRRPEDDRQLRGAGRPGGARRRVAHLRPQHVRAAHRGARPVLLRERHRWRWHGHHRDHAVGGGPPRRVGRAAKRLVLRPLEGADPHGAGRVPMRPLGLAVPSHGARVQLRGVQGLRHCVRPGGPRRRRHRGRGGAAGPPARRLRHAELAEAVAGRGPGLARALPVPLHLAEVGELRFLAVQRRLARHAERRAHVDDHRRLRAPPRHHALQDVAALVGQPGRRGGVGALFQEVRVFEHQQVR